jgi:hypothetical protein
VSTARPGWLDEPAHDEPVELAEILAEWAAGQSRPGTSQRGRAMTGFADQDYERAGGQDADQVTASPLDVRAEYEHGAATAWQMTEHSAASGRSAAYIEQRHLELNGPTADRAQRTAAESAWHRGYDAGADGSVSLLRDLEREAEAG